MSFKEPATGISSRPTTLLRSTVPFVTNWYTIPARQMVLQLRRWLPHRSLVLVGDNSYAVLDLLHCCQSLAQPVTLIARLRLDAALYPESTDGQGWTGRGHWKGERK